MSRISLRAGALVLAVGVVGCSGTADIYEPQPESGVLIAHLGRPGGDPEGLAAIQRAFSASNPGYSVEVQRFERSRPLRSDTHWVSFIQEAPDGAKMAANVGDEISDVTVGDIVLTEPWGTLSADRPVTAVTFTVPEHFPQDLPTFIRPDWDPDITDTPGGCATETGAYRRILLTWLRDNGPYTFHCLNAHRVRITDSFSHYHPIEGGFDEFYLVQMVQPGARLITSPHVDRIENPEGMSAEEAADLLEVHELRVGDLVYLPRGLMHRGVGGVLAQVITTPGFRPGAEIGVDHHLRAINEQLGLEGEAALPYHEAASQEAVVK